MGKWLWAAALLAFAPAAAPAQGATCRADRVELRGDWGSAAFRVEVADTAAERAQGLMFVEEMPPGEGMLFAYETEQPVAFWMKNTLIPLDMVFAGADGRVTRVHANAVPGDITPIPGGDAVRYVLEINGGLAARLGIEAGDEMRHPAIDAASDAPAWPC